ncbi:MULTISPECIES: metallophosphoesterase [unclassified Streptomyces]|uniref:metallophosphoesterase n=1 Tax=unclassified Streptomyces TaxID=2593676 RepID=UPI0037B64F8A
MTVLIGQLSDPHVQDPDVDPEPLRRFADALTAMAAEVGPDGRLLVTGDLTADGRPAQYAAVARAIGAAGRAVHVLPGNHDDRTLLARFVPAGPGERRVDLGSRMPSRCDFGEVVVLMLDSAVAGHSHGELGADQLRWLDEQLAAAPDTMHVVAVHHPPFAIGLAGIDRAGLADAGAFGEVLRGHDHVGRLLTGHVHRGVITGFAGVVATSCPSVWRSLPLDLRPDAPRRQGPFQDLGLLHLADAATVVTHVVSVPARSAG